MRLDAALAKRKRNLSSGLIKPVSIYKPTNTGEKFHESNAFIQYVRGSVGSGKTTMSIMQIPMLFMQMPVTVTNKRLAKAVIVRNTKSQLLTTTIASWKEHFPEETCGDVVKSPYMHQVHQFVDDDGVENIFEFIFLALDHPKDVRNLLSLEATIFYFNELKEIDFVHFYGAMGRIGRYPRKQLFKNQEDVEKMNAISRILADSNAPHCRHWSVEALEHNGVEDKIRGTDLSKKWEEQNRSVCDFFLQPAPLVREGDDYLPNPEAENIENLSEGYDYYYKQLAANEEWVNVYIMNEYGSVFDGQPVFPEYKSSLHRANKILEPTPGYPLYIGVDLGGTPAAVMLQYVDGQVRVLKEVISDLPIGVRSFIELRIMPILQSDGYRDLDYITDYDKAVGDPDKNTSVYRMDGKILQESGLRGRPCITNNERKRIESVKLALNRLAMGEPGFLLSRECQYLHDCLSGGYKYKQLTESGGRQRYAEKPDKDYYSHGMDALQYAIMRAIGVVMSDKKQKQDHFAVINGVRVKV